MYPDTEIEGMKRQFAAALARHPTDPMRAANLVETRTAHIQFIMSNWQMDPQVQQYMKELRTDRGAAAGVPSIDAFSEHLWIEANKCRDEKHKIELLKLFAEVAGYRHKPLEKGTTNVTIDNRRVIVAPLPQSMDDWENAATVSQQRLLNAAS